MEQYQHYIPQLLLRNFSHPYQVPTQSRSEQRRKYRFEKGKRPGDKVLNVVDLHVRGRISGKVFIPPGPLPEVATAVICDYSPSSSATV
ncbi:hypothetical protein PV08_03307 [Exophiala spinifera]|uniref:Uncharacterized protein n=1 Tax=Exophiala spinifera TaxID=91928 RepID=A0A0D2A286_9EURO|nr:uncharacterized protein PV08_03307 [Exophiala spinifera]KIW19017.1 hypothetical protein PV08_03307 [Exophiala spinifera]